jgi:predicted helicase
MSEPILIDQLAGDIWNVYAADTANAETNIEQFLETSLRNLPYNERLEALLRLIREYESIADTQTEELLFDNSIMARIFSLLLGKDVSATRLSTTELIQKLAESLNTIFDSMNLLITTINATLYGGASDDRTIRHVIGSHLKGEDALNSLEDHLKQVTKAFLTVQQAFKASAKTTVARVLDEMNPDMAEREVSGGLTIGPFRKAKLYDIYKDKYSRIKKWHESDKFIEDFLREFEKSCQALTKHG